ncbi:MAG: flagellar hook-associated protein FlgK [Oscillospiraceae bacterium]|jgi:flagellar hook-associated protein 1 FlgK|nr:flagellar hook-associated protein FlgK [Oscillospiraceae bacterium]
MRSSFLGLEVSKRSIQIAQKALDLTGHNMGNAATPGYTRQRVDTNALYLSSYRNWQTKQSKLSLAGQGVQAFGVSQVRDAYVDKRYRDINCYVSEYDTKVGVLTEIETTLDNFENVGLAQKISEFKTVLTNYAANAPDNKELASIVRNSASNICTMLNNYAKDLAAIKENNVFAMETTVGQANTVIEKIARLNEAIVNEYKATEFGNIVNGQGVSRYGPLELMDQRNLLIDELSGYADIRVTDSGDGSVKIEIGTVAVVDGSKTEKIILQDFHDCDAARLSFSNGEPAVLKSGEIKAYVDLLNGNGPYANFYQNSEYGIPYYQSAIDTFATDFAGWLNSLNGVMPDDGDTSRAMFGSMDDTYDVNGNLTKRGAITASNIRISDEWMGDPTIIGQNILPDGSWGYSPNLDGTHNNQILIGIEQAVPFGRALDFTGTPFEYVAFLSNRLGQGISFVQELYNTASNTANTLLDTRDSISGVSDTEEGINMMTYQKWFNASSRIMTAMDECLDRIINNMGIVGR